MTKIKKTYRLDELTVQRVQILKDFYSEQGFDLSDAQIIQKAVSNLMDVPVGNFKYEEKRGDTDV